MSVYINISNSVLTKLTVKRFAPDGTEYLLFDKVNAIKISDTFDTNPDAYGRSHRVDR